MYCHSDLYLPDSDEEKNWERYYKLLLVNKQKLDFKLSIYPFSGSRLSLVLLVVGVVLVVISVVLWVAMGFQVGVQDSKSWLLWICHNLVGSHGWPDLPMQSWMPTPSNKVKLLAEQRPSSHLFPWLMQSPFFSSDYLLQVHVILFRVGDYSV